MFYKVWSTFIFHHSPTSFNHGGLCISYHSMKRYKDELTRYIIKMSDASATIPWRGTEMSWQDILSKCQMHQLPFHEEVPRWVDKIYYQNVRCISYHSMKRYRDELTRYIIKMSDASATIPWRGTEMSWQDILSKCQMHQLPFHEEVPRWVDKIYYQNVRCISYHSMKRYRDELTRYIIKMSDASATIPWRGTEMSWQDILSKCQMHQLPFHEEVPRWVDKIYYQNVRCISYHSMKRYRDELTRYIIKMSDASATIPWRGTEMSWQDILSKCQMHQLPFHEEVQRWVDKIYYQNVRCISYHSMKRYRDELTRYINKMSDASATIPWRGTEMSWQDILSKCQMHQLPFHEEVQRWVDKIYYQNVRCISYHSMKRYRDELTRYIIKMSDASATIPWRGTEMSWQDILSKCQMHQLPFHEEVQRWVDKIYYQNVRCISYHSMKRYRDELTRYIIKMSDASATIPWRGTEMSWQDILSKCQMHQLPFHEEVQRWVDKIYYQNVRCISYHSMKRYRDELTRYIIKMSDASATIPWRGTEMSWQDILSKCQMHQLPFHEEVQRWVDKIYYQNVRCISYHSMKRYRDELTRYIIKMSDASATIPWRGTEMSWQDILSKCQMHQLPFHEEVQRWVDKIYYQNVRCISYHSMKRYRDELTRYIIKMSDASATIPWRGTEMSWQDILSKCQMHQLPFHEEVQRWVDKIYYQNVRCISYHSMKRYRDELTRYIIKMSDASATIPWRGTKMSWQDILSKCQMHQLPFHEEVQRWVDKIYYQNVKCISYHSMKRYRDELTRYIIKMSDASATIPRRGTEMSWQDILAKCQMHQLPFNEEVPRWVDKIYYQNVRCISYHSMKRYRDELTRYISKMSDASATIPWRGTEMSWQDILSKCQMHQLPFHEEVPRWVDKIYYQNVKCISYHSMKRYRDELTRYIIKMSDASATIPWRGTDMSWQDILSKCQMHQLPFHEEVPRWVDKIYYQNVRCISYHSTKRYRDELTRYIIKMSDASATIPWRGTEMSWQDILSKCQMHQLPFHEEVPRWVDKIY